MQHCANDPNTRTDKEGVWGSNVCTCKQFCRNESFQSDFCTLLDSLSCSLHLVFFLIAFGEIKSGFNSVTSAECIHASKIIVKSNSREGCLACLTQQHLYV